MISKKLRINVTFWKPTSKLLGLAQKNQTSVASIVRELTHEALEMREDIPFVSIGRKLDAPDKKPYSNTL